MAQATLPDLTTSTTLHILADNSTVISLIQSIAANCTLGNTSAIVAVPLNSSDLTSPRPEQAIQYYRASSVVLTLDGYNNTAALSDDRSIPDVPLPPWADQTFVNCVNQTIGTAVPLVNADGHRNWLGLEVGLPLGLLGCLLLYLCCCTPRYYRPRNPGSTNVCNA